MDEGISHKRQGCYHISASTAATEQEPEQQNEASSSQGDEPTKRASRAQPLLEASTSGPCQFLSSALALDTITNRPQVSSPTCTQAHTFPAASQPSAATLSNLTFHPFPRLAKELQLLIWNAALPSARVVEIEYSGFWWAPLESNARCGLPGANCDSREVFLKHYSPLCRYGRSDYSSHHYLEQAPADVAPQTHYYKGEVGLHCTNICYFDPKIDTLYLGPSSAGQFGRLARFGMLWMAKRNHQTYTKESLTALLKISCLSNLRYLACQYTEWLETCLPISSRPQDSRRLALFRMIWRFPNIERFDVTSEDADWSWFEDQKYARSVPGTVMEVSFKDHKSALARFPTRVDEAFKEYNEARAAGKKISFGTKSVSRGGGCSRNLWVISRRVD